MGSIPVAGAKTPHLPRWAVLAPARRTHLRERSEAESGSHPPTEDRQAGLPGAGRGDLRRRRISRWTVPPKKTPFKVGCFGTRTPNPSPRAKRCGIGFASPDRRSASWLARRRARGSSPMAKFPLNFNFRKNAFQGGLFWHPHVEPISADAEFVKSFYCD